MPEKESVPGVGSGLPDYNMLGTIVQLVVVLALIIGLIFLLIYFLSGKKRTWLSGRSLKLLGGIPLGPNRSLQVAQVGNKVYIVGVGENVQLIDKIEDEREIESIVESIESSYTGDRSLRTLMSRWLNDYKRRNGRESDPMDDSEQQDRGHSFHEVLQQKMKFVSDRSKAVEQMMNQQTNEERSDGR